MASEFAQANRYLRTCTRAAERYVIVPLFVETDGLSRLKREELDSDGVVYITAPREDCRPDRILEFTVTVEPKIDNSEGFVPMEKAGRLTDAGFYIVRVSHGQYYADLEINDDAIGKFAVHSANPRVAAFMEDMENREGKLRPTLLLRAMVGMYALGIGDFFDSRDGLRFQRAVKKALKNNLSAAFE